MSFKINESCIGCAACVKVCPTEAITGEKKKLHAVNPVLCIECGACGRICPEGSIENGRGHACQMIKRSAWPKPAFDNKQCSSCGICIDACPVSCLALSGEQDIHPYPYLRDAKACIACEFCMTSCPTGAIGMV
jgi:NAD-dependent dihydropyrimidine dehydrogenase PreA subunit